MVRCRDMRNLKTFSALTTAALSLTLAASAGAAAPTVVKVGSLPGTPAKYNKVFITKYGPSSAKKVLLLIPGTNGGAANFSLVGPELAKKVPGLQVWAMDRREQALEDNSMMQKVLANKATPQQALDYYLGWVLNPAQKDKFTPLQAKNFAFMKDWGMKMQLEDARAVILQAKKQGKTVILGGHSLGASMAAAYAAWDFNGKPGYKDIAGIVAIDGGLAGTFDATDTADAARANLAKLDVTTIGPLRLRLGNRPVRAGRCARSAESAQRTLNARWVRSAAFVPEGQLPDDQRGRARIRIRQ